MVYAKIKINICATYTREFATFCGNILEDNFLTRCLCYRGKSTDGHEKLELLSRQGRSVFCYSFLAHFVYKCCGLDNRADESNEMWILIVTTNTAHNFLMRNNVVIYSET